jgi:hypothetical protein
MYIWWRILRNVLDTCSNAFSSRVLQMYLVRVKSDKCTAFSVRSFVEVMYVIKLNASPARIKIICCIYRGLFGNAHRGQNSVKNVTEGNIHLQEVAFAVISIAYWSHYKCTTQTSIRKTCATGRTGEPSGIVVWHILHTSLRFFLNKTEILLVFCWHRFNWQ